MDATCIDLLIFFFFLKETGKLMTNKQGSTKDTEFLMDQREHLGHALYGSTNVIIQMHVPHC